MNTLKAYHGTPAGDFLTFTHPETRNTANETNSLGFWFTDSKSVAMQFAVSTKKSYETNGETWPDGELKQFVRDIPVLGGIHEVKLHWKNPMIFESDNSQKEEYEKQYRTLLDEHGILLWRMSVEVSVSQRMETHRRYNEVEKLLEELKRKIENDSFEMFMDNRDVFCKYINAKKGAGSWRDHYILENKEEANKEYVAYLKSQGYDGIWIKSTVYDSVDQKSLLDQYLVFAPEMIEKIQYEPLQQLATEEEISSLIKKKIEQFSWF